MTGSFTVPDGAPGYYVVLATQTVASGAPAAGTPARHAFRIRKASSSRKRSAELVPVAGVPGGGGGPSAPVVLVLTTGLLALLGGSAWLTTAARNRRRPAVPVTGRVS